MNQKVELLPGAFFIPLQRHEDLRGSFVKPCTLDPALIPSAGFQIREHFYSISKRNVVRGMHFQAPPFDVEKIVHCATGSALDVLIDLRRGPFYGKTARVVIHSECPSILFLPPGIGHGFKSLEDDTLIMYLTSREHSREHDRGIRWDSIGEQWDFHEDEHPLISEKDAALPLLSDFVTPFV